MFCEDNRADIKAANPDAGFGEIGKLLAAAWKECDADTKTQYQEQSQVAPVFLILSLWQFQLYALLCVSTSIAGVISRHQACDPAFAHVWLHLWSMESSHSYCHMVGL